MNNNRNKWKRIVSIVLVFVIISCLLVIFKDFFDTVGSEKELDNVRTIVHKNIENIDYGFSKETFDELKEINSDFVAYIEFDSGIISLPVLQTSDNEYYLHHTIYRNYYYLHGHPFMNCDSKLTDQNIIIYGHNNRTSANKMFSPLNSMFQQENYKKNAYFKIYFENSVRSYVITHIYELTDAEYQDYDFERPFILDNEWDEWIGYANRKNVIIPIDGSLNKGDRFVTLQTCSVDNENIVVVLAREISNTPYWKE